jgi:4-hydroxymandelate oxidase
LHPALQEQFREDEGPYARAGRHGSNVVKALAIGATAVCVGRPYLWDLGAFGQAGVEHLLGILRNETRLAMQQLGAPSLKDITPDMARRA